MIKSYNEVTHYTHETYFFHRKPQKLKIAKNVYRKVFSKNLSKHFSSIGKSHGADKNEKRSAMAEILK